MTQIKNIKEQWTEMRKLYKCAGWEAVDLCMSDYIKDIHNAVKDSI